MPLSGTGGPLGDLIRTKIDALTDEDKQDREKLFREMGAAIIEHLTGSAGAGAVNVTVTSVTGVTAGAATSGPGTGTGDLQ